MTARKKNIPSIWIDPDDAPELTDEDFARGVWAIGEKVVSRDAAQKTIKKAMRGRPPGTVCTYLFINPLPSGDLVIVFPGCFLPMP